MTSRICVCVPARNEQDDLPALLASLAAQTYAERFGVVITLNNCSDGSAGIAREAARRYAGRLAIVPDVVCLDPPDDHVGVARARALRLGADWLDRAGVPRAEQVLLSTDADAMAPPDWVAGNLAAIDAGADVVGGRLRAVTDASCTSERIRLATLIDEYWENVRALEDRIDPVPEDPAPRHGDHTGASLAVRRLVHDAVGGIPNVRTGEDTAFVRAAIALGYRLRHPADLWIAVSARENVRATGGMAADMMAIRLAAEGNTPIHMPAADQWADRAAWRARIRHAGGAAAVVRLEQALPRMRNDTPIEQAVADLKALSQCG